MPPGRQIRRKQVVVENQGKSQKKKQKDLLERLGSSSFPPAAVLGAFASFTSAAINESPAGAGRSNPAAPLIQITVGDSGKKEEPANLGLKYIRAFALAERAPKHAFRQSLTGIAAGPADRIFALGDEELRIFEKSGEFIQSFRAPVGAMCISVDAEERIYFGSEGRVDVYGRDGARFGGFAVSENGKPGLITAIKIYGREIFAADAAAKYIRRYDFSGKQLGVIGVQGKIRGFMLPNKSLDFALNGTGTICAADPGRHRVSMWKADGFMVGKFGKFGLTNPEDFVGCCNPVNLAVLRDGSIITAEKVASRVKVYDPDGRLKAIIGPENFDPRCVHLHLAVDSRQRILVGDPIRRNIQIFSALDGTGDGKSV